MCGDIWKSVKRSWFSNLSLSSLIVYGLFTILIFKKNCLWIQFLPKRLYCHVVDVVVTFIWDEPLFIFWYEEYVVLSALRRVSEICSCMNEDIFFPITFCFLCLKLHRGPHVTLRCFTWFRNALPRINYCPNRTLLLSSDRQKNGDEVSWSMKTSVVMPGRELCGWLVGI